VVDDGDALQVAEGKTLAVGIGKELGMSLVRGCIESSMAEASTDTRGSEATVRGKDGGAGEQKQKVIGRRLDFEGSRREEHRVNDDVVDDEVLSGACGEGIAKWQSEKTREETEWRRCWGRSR
jgi:hypothetical protein